MVFKEGVEYVGINAFENCRNLEKIVWAKSIKEVGEYAFAGCSSLKKVKIPTSVERWGDKVFYKSGLEQVNIPASRTWWGYCVFAKCPELKKVVFEEGIEFREIIRDGRMMEFSGAWMFYDCKALEEVVFPKKMKMMPVGIFEECSALKKYRWPEDIEFEYWSPEEKNE